MLTNIFKKLKIWWINKQVVKEADWGDYPCPNCGNTGVKKGVRCICGSDGIFE